MILSSAAAPEGELNYAKVTARLKACPDTNPLLSRVLEHRLRNLKGSVAAPLF